MQNVSMDGQNGHVELSHADSEVRHASRALRMMEPVQEGIHEEDQVGSASASLRLVLVVFFPIWVPRTRHLR